MKILIVNTVPVAHNGITGVIFNYLESFPLDSNDQIGLVCINNPNSTFKTRLKKIGVDFHVTYRNIRNPIGYIRKIKSIAKGYDIIHVHGNSATMILEMVAAKLAGVPLRIAHSHNTSCSLKIVDFVCRPLFYLLCNARVACGEAAGKWLFKNKPFKVLNNGIFTSNFTYNEENRRIIRKKLNIGNTCLLFGNIGNFVESKNHHFLIDVFASIKKRQSEAKLLLLGSGDGMSSVKDHICKLDLQEDVIVEGSVDNPQVYLSAMDFIIMPSLFEGLPLTLVEEQANGLNCLVSDVITKEVDMTGNLFFYPLKEGIEKWANTALNLAYLRQDRLKKSLVAIKKIKECGFDIHKNAVDLKVFYSKELSFVNEK